MQHLQYIIIGDPLSPSFTFSGDDILSTSGDLSVDMIGAELCTDVMEAEVSYNDADGMLRALPWATPVYFYRGEHLEGKLYSISVTRIGRTAYRIRTTSAAGILEYETFYGNMYTGETFQTVAEQIIGSNGLQPYDGVYKRFFREKDATASSIKGIGMGAYSDESKETVDANGPILSATMSSKLSAKIKILGFTNDGSISLSETKFRSRLLGVVGAPGQSKNAEYHQYGLYMDMERPSSWPFFPKFGDVFFVYGDTEISLGTPVSAEKAVYVIDVDPNANTAVINGTTFELYHADTSIDHDPCALHVYGGGAEIIEDSAGLKYTVCNHHCDLEVYHYTVRSPDDLLEADYAAVRDNYTGAIDIFDRVSHKLQRNVANSAVLPVDLEPYDVSTYGEFPLFNNRTVFQTDVLTSLAYADGIDTLPIYGWLPICTKREALHQLLFATGVILIKNENGTIRFTAPSLQAVKNIDDDAIYDEGSEDQPEHTNTLELTEHAYVLNTTPELEVIYENNIGSSSEYCIAAFSKAPAKQEESSGLTCLYANCNAALVTGTGTLTGHTYSHTETVLKREIASFPDGHGVSVADATLVTMLNSENVMDRLEAYYGAARKTHVDIAMNGERCGLAYALTSAFGENFSGFMARASKVFTSVVRATCEFILGYNPPSISPGYTDYVILTGSGTWTVPASVYEKEMPRIRVVLIGGGDGGDSGFAGADGEEPAAHSSGSPAEGGAAGESGNGGKVFEVTITNPAASYAYNCGQGGAGGSTTNSHSSNNPGSAGGDTTFIGGDRSYSSANGSSTEMGIVNSINGDLYAGRLVHALLVEDADRAAGGDGGWQQQWDGGTSYHSAGSADEIIMGTVIDSFFGGKEGANYRSSGGAQVRGGCGGGAGYGQNGFDGSDAHFSHNKFYSGNGGNGGNATKIPPKATDYNSSYYGYGGLGGGGGGGGGSAGWRAADYENYVSGRGGYGGFGGRGGDGGDGCVLIYY